MLLAEFGNRTNRGTLVDIAEACRRKASGFTGGSRPGVENASCTPSKDNAIDCGLISRQSRQPGLAGFPVKRHGR